MVVSGWPIRLNHGFDSRFFVVVSFYPVLVKCSTSSNVVTVNSQRKYAKFLMLSFKGYKLCITKLTITYSNSSAPENIVFPDDMGQASYRHLNNALKSHVKLSSPAPLPGVTHAKLKFPLFAVKYENAKLHLTGMISDLRAVNLKNRLVLFFLSTDSLLEKEKAKKHPLNHPNHE